MCRLQQLAQYASRLSNLSTFLGVRENFTKQKKLAAKSDKKFQLGYQVFLLRKLEKSKRHCLQPETDLKTNCLILTIIGIIL